MRRRLGFFSLPAVFLTCAILQAVAPTPAVAQRPDEPAERDVRELIVLISGRVASGTPRLAVDAINEGRSAPYALGVGNPRSARLAVRERARGRTAEWIRHNPDTPEGRLQRYIVMRYRGAADRGRALENLSRNPFVQHVEENLSFEMHGLPSDPYVGTGIENPGEAQWGVHALNFPAAWELTRGHALIGFIDEGLEVSHPELRVSHDVGGVPVFDGGGFRAHLSRDVLNNNCSVDELDPDDDPDLQDDSPGHGTHVMGIAAARIDNAMAAAWRPSTR